MPQKIHFIDTHADYLNILDIIKDAPIYFLDTEFIREKTYRPIVALIQIAINDKDAYLIDPTFVDFDAKLLFDILNNPNKKIVLHSARQDLEIFYYHYHFTPHTLEDTQIIASALGYGEQIGFEGLVKAITGDVIDKSQQRTDWLKRPLNQEQLTYAAYDVLYLAKVYPYLESALTSQGRLEWISDDIKNLCNPNIFTISNEAILKKIKHSLTSNKGINALQALAILREKIAIDTDSIRTLICPDSILITLAEKRPKTIEGLHKLKHIKHEFIHKYHAEIIETLVNADENPVVIPKFIKPERLTLPQEKLINILSVAADAIANNHAVARRLFASNADIIEFIKTNNAPFLSGWRYDLFGCIVHDILNGSKGLFYKHGHIIVE
jgi:ribonuclease D